MAAPGITQVSARLPQGLAFGPGATCAAVCACEGLLGAQGVHLGASSDMASSWMHFFSPEILRGLETMPL